MKARDVVSAENDRSGDVSREDAALSKAQARLLFQRERALEATRLLSEALFQRLTVDDLIQKALHTALDVVGAEAGSVLLADPESKQLVFRHSVGENPVPAGTAISWDQGIAGSVFTTGEPAVIPDVRQDSRYFGGIDKSTGYETRDIIVLPLKRWEGAPIGVLNVLNKRGSPLNKDDLGILTIISSLTATAIEQARLFEEAKLAEIVHRIGDIGHDVKNMLTPVVLGSKILQEELDALFQDMPKAALQETDVSQKRCDMVIGMLNNSARRIQDRVKEIADCMKNLSSPPVFSSCRIATIVQAVFNDMSFLAEEKSISLRAEGLDVLPALQADERRLYNAFYNLVNNAIPEVSTGGSITISGHLQGDHLLITFADTGRGMPARIRDSLFTSRAISPKPGGTGLGTKIVKDVVDAHGGTITVESQENVGTTFHIRLPLHPPGSSADHQKT
jgi:signal transduction histidine kinase